MMIAPFAAFAPALLIVGVVLAHALYCALNGRSQSQQRFFLTTINQPTHDARAQIMTGDGVGITGGDDRLLLVTLGAQRPLADEPQLARTVLFGSNIAEAGMYAANLLCTEDLHVPEATRFLGSVNVGGDLLVVGDAVFEGVVIVDGYIHVAGSARFESGLINRSDMLISGSAEIGSLHQESWMAARRIELKGALALNGRLFAREGIHRSAA